MSPLEDWLNDPVGRAKADALLRQLSSVLGVVFGADTPVADDSELAFHDYFLTMPLADVVEFASVIGSVDAGALS